MDMQTFNSLTLDQLISTRVDARQAKVGDIVFCRGYYSLVLEVRESGQYENAGQTWTRYEVITNNGIRFYGTPA